jgi:hypothetical protein
MEYISSDRALIAQGAGDGAHRSRHGQWRSWLRAPTMVLIAQGTGPIRCPDGRPFLRVGLGARCYHDGTCRRKGSEPNRSDAKR